MSIELHTFNDILHLHLRPWKVDYSTQKFQKLLKEIKRETYQYQPNYEIAFIKPVNDKRKFYHALITNEAIKFLNSLHREVESAINEKERIFWATSAINKQLKPKFNELNNIIDKKNYRHSNINFNNDDAYIIQFLKYQVIRLYLEVQDSFPLQLNDDPITQEEIHSNYFTDPPFDKQVIIAEERVLVPERKVPSTPKAPAEKFIPHNHEIRDEKEGVLLYDELVFNPERFGRIEAILSEDKYIDKDFVLSDNQGNIKKLAAVGQVLYQNNFFKKITFHKEKKVVVKDVHIKDFLDHRYRTNIDQEFRRFRNENALKKFIENNRWISLLPSS